MIWLMTGRSVAEAGVRIFSFSRFAAMGVVACAIGAAPSWSASRSDEIVVTGPTPHPFNAPVVVDAALSHMRGGVMLPGGLSIAVGIDIETRVDGLLAVHTIYNTDGPDAGIRVFTDGAAQSPLPPGTVTVQTDGTETPSVVVSRSPTGTTVDLSTAQMPIKVNLLSGPPSTWATAAGQTPVPVVENGAAVVTPAGDISLATDDRGAVVTLQSPTLLIQQVIGQANGVIVGNAVSDRVIDTVSSLNLDLHGLSPELTAGLALSDQLALAVATNR